MKNVSRREFLQIGGIGLAGLTLPGFRFPIMVPRQAVAFSGNAWKFGVMADTQWKSSTEPATCATTIIDALNDQFIQHGCKFVIQVGDLVNDEESNKERNLPTRAAHAQALYDAGIGFFACRGNHESSATAAAEMLTLFPQNLGEGDHLFGASNFQSPTLAATENDPTGERLKGLSYTFDYDNVRCILIDQFHRPNDDDYTAGTYNDNMLDQVDWVTDMVSSASPHQHTLVFSHKNLIGQNHKDNLFGEELTSNAEARDTFLTNLYQNNVAYYLGGHDHMHHRSMVSTADGSASVSQIICASNSYKFYTPQAGDDGRETPLEQELYTIGYYIFTVDGPLMTVDYYSASHGSDYGSVSLTLPPETMVFYQREHFGCSLDGNQFEIAHGESYTKVSDSYRGTAVKILGGVNGNTETDFLSRPLAKVVSTGWTEAADGENTASHVLTLWGMADNLSLYDGDLTGILPDADESQAGDTFTLSLSYDFKAVDPACILRGAFGLAVRDEDGNWVNAVDLNSSGTPTFKRGPWKADDALGTWGVDPGSRTVWAVIDHGGTFVAKAFESDPQGHRGKKGRKTIFL